MSKITTIRLRAMRRFVQMKNNLLPILITILCSCVDSPNNKLNIDDDLDGFSEFDGDCDDANASTYPGAAFLDSETDCMLDSDGDGYGSSVIESEQIIDERMPILLGTDCDDNDAASTHKSIDADCDNLDQTIDCNDNDSNSTSTLEDADCDGTITNEDCDDENPNSTIRTNDQDCDGVIAFDVNGNQIDCNDNASWMPLYGCAQGVSCLDILEQEDTTSGEYSILPFGSEEPYDVYCDMTTDGGGWTLVHQDDFENTVSSFWNETTTSTCGTFGNILGGHNILGTGIMLEMTLQGIMSHTEVRVLFDFIRIDSWDDEQAYAYIDNSLVWSQEGLGTTGEQICGWGPENGWGHEERWSESVQMDHSLSEIHLLFTTSLDQDSFDESWGIDNVYIWVR